MLRNLPLLAWLFAGCVFNQPIGASDFAAARADAATPGTLAGGCLATGATGAITLPAVSGIPARTTGVAPLAVFFDAAGTTATATARPFHDLEYRWSFGDGASTWNAGSRAGSSSRNEATGPVAAHVYETPGTYTVSLDVADGANTVSNRCIRIVVQDPDVVFAGANTICVGATSMPAQGVGGCPVGAKTAQQPSFAAAVNAYALTGKRLLFKRGDTFTTNGTTSATTASITHTGPGIVAAFGTGAAPVVRITNNNSSILVLSGKITPGISDWRVMDLDLDGSLVPDEGALCLGYPRPAGRSCNNVIGIGAGGGINQITLLRLKVHEIHSGIVFGDTTLDWWNGHGYPRHTMFDQVAITDSSVLRAIGGTGGGGVLLTGNRLSMQGNIVDDAMFSEHIIRAFYLNRSVISNNTLSRQAPTKGIIKMHGPTWCNVVGPAGTCLVSSPQAPLPTDSAYSYLTSTPPLGVSGAAGGYTEQVVLSDNKFVSADNTAWTVVAGPQHATADERLRNIIVERNWFVAGNTTQAALVVNAADVTVRNNICDIPNGACVQVSMRGEHIVKDIPVYSPEPPPVNVHVYNNTFYSASTGNFNGVNIRAPSTNTIVRNNLGSAPVATPQFRVMVNNAGTRTVQADNLLNNAPSALFVSVTPTVPADFRLLPLPNPARNKGSATVPVFSDFFRNPRSQGAPDMGAVEGP